MTINTSKVSASRVAEFNQDNIKFGSLYSDHMLVATYKNGAWQTCNIVPYENLSMSPATTCMHYGQAIFEGIKAYKTKNGDIKIFRPQENWKRFNKSAQRMGMPDVPEHIFLEGMKQLIALDKNWVPDAKGTSLYIRPFMLGVDEFIGVKPAEEFQFIIITSPAGDYYAQPIKIFVHDKYTRACAGGVGEAKAAGNYGATMMPMMEVRKMGFDQILWTDAVHHKYVQEIGTMNVFFVINNIVITPSLEGGTILAGVTRASMISLLQEKGIEIQERPISIDEIYEAHLAGTFTECFGAGTAAVVAPIASLHYEGKDMVLPAVENSITAMLKAELSDIRYGDVADTHGWMFDVCSTEEAVIA
jgi:branched-chain amino acid aminotransferase